MTTPTARRIVRFEIDSLQAMSVSLAGTFNDWKPGATPFRPLGGGKWLAEISLAPGRYEYRFVVDGKWVDPPHARGYVPNPHGGRNAIVQV
jgi:1,4-alpha-glucan branching enzyme